MEIYERIRLLRKNHLKMSQEKFGAALGVGRVVIKNIELNLLARPEQKEPLLRLICETFNVSYDWLTKGEGEMYVTTPDALVDRLAGELSLSDTARKLLKHYVNLDDERKASLDILFEFVADAITEAPVLRAQNIKVNTFERAVERMDMWRAAHDDTEHASELGDISISDKDVSKIEDKEKL